MTRTPPTRLPPFEHVVATHGPAVLRFCAAHVGAVRAEDCFQETMISALRAYAQMRDAGAIRAWLFTIAARTAIDFHRSRARDPLPAPADELPLPAAPPPQDGVARDAELWSRVRALPEKQRQAVALRYLGDLSHREIAVAMQTSEPAARRNVFEGLSRLRKDLDDESS